jgi:hypothetical protein
MVKALIVNAVYCRSGKVFIGKGFRRGKSPKESTFANVPCPQEVLKDKALH